MNASPCLFPHFFCLNTHPLYLFTIRVPDVNLRDATALGIDVIGPVEHGDRPLDKAHTTGKVERSVAFSVTDQRVGISLEEVLDDLVLTG